VQGESTARILSQKWQILYEDSTGGRRGLVSGGRQDDSAAAMPNKSHDRAVRTPRQRLCRAGHLWLCVFLVSVIAYAGDVGGEDVPEGSVNAASLEFCVQETNRLRTMNGRAPVVRSKQLDDFANSGARIDHDGPAHGHFNQARDSGIAFAENECRRWSLDQSGGDMKKLVELCIAAFYAEGPGGGHYENMLGDYHSLGCGIFQSGADVTIVQDFGE